MLSKVSATTSYRFVGRSYGGEWEDRDVALSRHFLDPGRKIASAKVVRVEPQFAVLNATQEAEAALKPTFNPRFHAEGQRRAILELASPPLPRDQEKNVRPVTQR